MVPDGWVAKTNAGGGLEGGQFVCPHCGLAATFQVMGQVFSPPRRAAIIKCNAAACGNLIYVQSDVYRDYQDLQVYWPTAVAPAPHESIPSAVGDDWLEAQMAFRAGALKAAAVMCRRVLYGVLLQQGCREHPLRDGLNDLAAKASLPPLMRQKLDEIKDDGHDAAHPSRALQVDAANVAESVEFTADLLRYVYEEPWKLERRYQRKQAGSKP